MATSLLELSEAAASKARELLARSAHPEGALRVRVIQGGCSGQRYELLFDHETRPGDRQLDQHGVKVWIDAESANYLDGVSIDYSDALNDAGFKIQNPRAQETCGCGESFKI